MNITLNQHSFIPSHIHHMSPRVRSPRRPLWCFTILHETQSRQCATANSSTPSQRPFGRRVPKTPPHACACSHWPRRCSSRTRRGRYPTSCSRCSTTRPGFPSCRGSRRWRRRPRRARVARGASVVGGGPRGYQYGRVGPRGSVRSRAHDARRRTRRGVLPGGLRALLGYGGWTVV